VSATPQDFHLWSQLTGNPYPRTPAEQMYLAPHVRSFVQNIGRQGGYVPQQQSGLRRVIDFAGKAALAAGGLTLAALAGKHYLDNRGAGVEDVNVNTEPEEDYVVYQSRGSTPGAPSEMGGPSPKPSPGGGGSGGLGRPSGVVVRPLGLLPASSEPATVRIAKAPSPAGPGPESLAGESSIQLGTPYETPVQRAEGQNDLTLYGQPKPGAVEVFRSSEHYARMKNFYPGMQDIISPTAPASTIHEQLPQTVRESRDVTPPTIGQINNQGNIPLDIRARQIAKGAAPATVASETIVSQPATVASRIAGSQTMGAGEGTQVSQAPAVPTGATVHSRPAGPSAQEARELMETLNRTHLHIPRDQREMLRDQLLADKYSQSSAPSLETTVQSGTISPKKFLEQKTVELSPLEAAKQNIRIRQEASRPTTEFQNLGYSKESTDEGEYDPHYLNLLQSHLERTSRPSVAPGSASHLAQLAQQPSQEELLGYHSAHGRAYPTFFQY
jgi:hypothetical protein